MEYWNLVAHYLQKVVDYLNCTIGSYGNIIKVSAVHEFSNASTIYCSSYEYLEDNITKYKEIILLTVNLWQTFQTRSVNDDGKWQPG